MTDKRHYQAFISYSHSDERWARWLQRALEKYRLPKTLRQTHPHLPARLYPIFRDRDELASGGDLSESIRKAMDDSAALIVICSPTARASRWVNEEIRRFRASGRGHRIFCLLVSGSPDPLSAECAFPTALLQDDAGNALLEPLAADASPGGDGKRNAMLKIAAGLLDLGVDDLKRRDAQRQARFWSIVAFGSLFITALTIGLAVFALNARREADIRRSQAENLIGFILGDLRKNLEPIGKLELLDSVGDQAMKYFAAIGAQGSEKEMLERAKAMKQIGDVRFNQGELEPALKAFEQALSQTKALYASAPANNDYLFELGQAEFWVGYVAWQRGQLDKASTSMRRYMEISRELAERDSNNADYQLELSYAYSNLGSVSVAQGRFEEALKAFGKGAEIGKKLLAANAGDADLAMNLSDTLSWIGTTQINLGQLQAARTAFGDAADIVRPLHNKDTDQRTSDYYARVLLQKIDTLIQMGETSEAEALLTEAQTIYTKRIEIDATNKFLLTDMLKADIYRLTLQPISAWGAEQQANLSRHLQVAETMAQTYPDDRHVQLNLRQAHTLKLNAGLTSEKPEDLLKLALQFWQAWQRRPNNQKLDLEMQHAGGALAYAVGRCQALTGHRAEAATLWQNARKALSEIPSRNPEIIATRWRLALALGLREEAAILQTQLSRLGYVDPYTSRPASSSGANQAPANPAARSNIK